MTAVDAARIPLLAHDEAMALQGRELDRTVSLLASPAPEQWGAKADCPDWDVRRMYLHVSGACEAGARVREGVRQLAVALVHRRRAGGPLEAALSAVQVRARQALTPEEVVARLRTIAPATVRGRRRIPAPVRRVVRIPVDGPVEETWTLGYLVDAVYLRDLWMHRVDAARATGRPLTLTADHDGRIVADVVREWARRHRKPFVLDRQGPAGGVFEQEPHSRHAEHFRLDAVEFCRTLAGRTPATGLLATVVPF